MSLNAQDQSLLQGARDCRQRARELDLDGMPARLRELAIEMIQTSTAELERIARRTEFEGIEANESWDLYKDKHATLINSLARLLQELEAASATDHELQRFVAEHPKHELSSRDVASLEASVARARKFTASALGRAGQARINAIDASLEEFRQARLDFERENAEFADAERLLEESRHQVYVSILNARDLMRAALRELDRLEELDAVIPPLADILNS